MLKYGQKGERKMKNKIILSNLNQAVLEDGISKQRVGGLIGLTSCEFSNLLRGKYDVGKLTEDDIKTLCRFFRKSKKYLLVVSK